MFYTNNECHYEHNGEILNMENKTSGLIKELKQSVEERKARENDNYWDEVKNSTKRKSRLKR